MIGGSEVSINSSESLARELALVEAPAESWRELAPWRETAIFHCTAPHLRRWIEYLGKKLAETTGERFTADDLGESCLRAELRAVARDLRHLQGFSARMGESARASDLDADDRRLAAIARQLARVLAKLAVRAEKQSGPAPQR